MVRIRFCRAALAAALVLTPAAFAASGLAGRVVDRSGDPVPGATVRLDCAAGDAPRFLLADELGRFRVPLPAGCQPRLSASLPGLAGVESAPVTATAGRPLELRLDVDLYRDHIEVQASAERDQVGSREIRESFARDAGEAAARVPGVVKLRKGPLAADIVLRGLKGDDLTVLIDGQRVFGACPNRMDPPAFHADFAELERIDVAKGPFDPATGGLGGTVNLVTRVPAPGVHAEAQTSGGAYGYWSGTANASWAGARASVRAGWAMRRGDVYEDGDGTPFTALLPAAAPAAYRDRGGDGRAFDVETGWARVSVTPAAGQRLDASFTRQQADRQLYPYLMMDASRDNATRARLAWRLERGEGWLRSLSAAFGRAAVDHDMDDHLRVSASAAMLGWSMRTHAESRVVDERLEAQLAGGWSLGIDADQRAWDATTTMAGMGGPRPQRALPDATLDSAALWARREAQLAPGLRLRAGVRCGRAASAATRSLADTALFLAYHGTTSTARRDTLAGGSVALDWQPASAWELSASLGRAERAPSPQERYFGLRRMGTDWVGNPELDPAAANQLDLGARYHSGRLAADFDAWYSRVDRFITVVEVPRAQTVPGVMNPRARTWANQDARLWGAEGSLRFDLGAGLALAASATWTRGVRALDPAHGVVDRDLPEMPPLTGRLSLRWERAAWAAEVEGVAAARQERVDGSLLEEPTPGWGIANLRGGWQGERFSVLAGIDNLFDRAYREHLSYLRDPFRSGARVPEPGRVWTLALRWRS